MEPSLQFSIREPQHPYGEPEKVLERLLHCIWSEQLFRKTLSLNGKKLVISSPGWWNLEAGPDFRNAEIFIDDERFCGDVEIHLHTNDWIHHQHHADARYNNVILHVVLYSSGSECKTSDGRVIRELEMKDHLAQELRLLQKRIPIHQFPFGIDTNIRLCRRFIEEQDEVAMERIFDSAGDLRLKQKKEKFRQILQDDGILQAFYEGFMEAMGYKQSRYAFRELAQRVPLKELIEYDLPNRRGIDAMAAVLLGTGGLLRLSKQMGLFSGDNETISYTQELLHYWKRAEVRYEAKQLTGFTWYPSSTRPANFPVRRLTAVAAFFHYFRQTLPDVFLMPCYEEAEPHIRHIVYKWLRVFDRPIHIYWSYHYQFDGHKFIAPKRLIGRERAKILIVNVVLPLLLALAETHEDAALEELLHRIWRKFPRLSENSITRLMEHRLFGDRKRARTLVKTAHRQQALHHFFYDFCDNQNTSCSRCEFNQPRKKKARKKRKESNHGDH